MSYRSQAQRDRRKALADTAKATIATTPSVAAELPHLDVMDSTRLDLATLPPLDPAKCPQFMLSGGASLRCGTTIRVINQDSFDAAIAMPPVILDSGSSDSGSSDSSALPALLKTVDREAEIFNHLKATALSPSYLNSVTAARVAVLNMASEVSPGGGWLRGANAQEEALCYRSSLAASLRRQWYPIPARAGLHTRDVVIFRTSTADGHALMVPRIAAAELPVVSVLSVAAIRRPATRRAGDGQQSSGGRLLFASDDARRLTKDKMRLCLRMAAAKGHTMLLLGALGCGAFKNPSEEVADCWLEVLREAEFAGGWFKAIWFAVYDTRNEGNFAIFRRALDGKTVGVSHEDAGLGGAGGEEGEGAALAGAERVGSSDV